MNGKKNWKTIKNNFYGYLLLKIIENEITVDWNSSIDMISIIAMTFSDYVTKKAMKRFFFSFLNYANENGLFLINRFFFSFIQGFSTRCMQIMNLFPFTVKQFSHFINRMWINFQAKYFTYVFKTINIKAFQRLFTSNFYRFSIFNCTYLTMSDMLESMLLWKQIKSVLVLSTNDFIGKDIVYHHFSTFTHIQFYLYRCKLIFLTLSHSLYIIQICINQIYGKRKKERKKYCDFY